MALLKEAWAIVKDQRSLWWLGMLAGVGQGYGWNPQFSREINARLDPGQLQTYLENIRPEFLVILAPLFIIVLIVWLLSLMAEAGLMKLTAGKDKERISFRRGLALGKKYLWPLIKLNLLLAMISLLVGLMIGAPSAAVANSGVIGRLSASLGFAVVLVFGLLLALLYPWMTRFLILGEKNIWSAIISAWRVLQKKPGGLVKIGLGGIIWQIIVALFILLLLLPFLLIVLYLVYRGEPLSPVVFLPVVTATVVVTLILMGIYTALKNAYYTSAFRQLVQEE